MESSFFVKVSKAKVSVAPREDLSGLGMLLCLWFLFPEYLLGYRVQYRLCPPVLITIKRKV